MSFYKNSHKIECKSSKKFGFSLIEVLVALAIFSTSVAMISYSFMNGLISQKSCEIEDPFEVDLPFLREQILSAKSKEDLKNFAQNIITPKTGKVDCKYSLEETKILNLFKLKLEFTYTENKKEKKYMQTLFVFQPLWADQNSQQNLFDKKYEEYLKKHPKSQENEENEEFVFLKS